MSYDPDRLYRPAELAQIGNPQKLNQWRFYGRGPAYIKLGQQVVYSGKDLNDFLERSRVVPTAKENKE